VNSVFERNLGGLVSLMLVAAALLASPTVKACSCMQPAPLQPGALHDSALVFSGTVIDVEYPPPRQIFNAQEQRLVEVTGSMDPVVWRFRVEGVWRGEAGRQVEIESARGSASCGYEFEPGARYLVFATRNRHGNFQTGLCSRTSRWDQALIERYALGQPVSGGTKIDAPPMLEDFESMLLGDDEGLGDLALNFWDSSDCGLNFLSWHLEDLKLPAHELRRLQEHSASFSTRSTIAARNPSVAFARSFNYRTCTVAERRWVRARIHDGIREGRFDRD